MLVKFKKSISSSEGWVYRPGQIVEIDPEEVPDLAHMLNASIAEEIKSGAEMPDVPGPTETTDALGPSTDTKRPGRGRRTKNATA